MQRNTTLIATSILIGTAAIAAPPVAHARFGASAIAEAAASALIAQPAQYYTGYRDYRAPRTYAPRTYAPRYHNAPPYRYPGSRDALDTCAFC
jgi:hypothetical protein